MYRVVVSTHITDSEKISKNIMSLIYKKRQESRVGLPVQTFHAIIRNSRSA
jgi:hypothetical protein